MYSTINVCNESPKHCVLFLIDAKAVFIYMEGERAWIPSILKNKRQGRRGRKRKLRGK